MYDEQFFQALGLTPEDFAVPEELWAEVRSTLPEDIPEFLTQSFCEKYFPVSGLAEEYLPRIRKICHKIAENPAIQQYAWFIHHCTYLRVPVYEVDEIPPLEHIFGEDTGLFHAIINMSSYPRIEATYERMGVPVDYAHKITANLGCFDAIHQLGHNGMPGCSLEHLFWMRVAACGKLFRIGRLEFTIDNYPEWMPAIYRHRTDGSLKVFCRPSWRVTSDGRRAFGYTPDAQTQSPPLSIVDGMVCGTEINPYGVAQLGTETTISLTDYESVISPWQHAPSIHIPAGGGLTPAVVKESLLEARDFFRKYLRQDFPLFLCHSWILSPIWESLLPNSNIAMFAREGYLTLDTEHQGDAGIYFVYGKNGVDPKTAPATNTIQKIFQQEALAGRPQRGGTTFFLTDKLEEYGTQYYRANANS